MPQNNQQPTSATTEEQLQVAQQKLMSQLQEAIQQYDEIVPKDRLILRLVSAIVELDHEVTNLRSSHLGRGLELEMLRDRVEMLEEKVQILQHKTQKAEFPDLVAAFTSHSKTEKLTAIKKSARRKRSK